MTPEEFVKIRETLGLTPQQLADKLGIGKSHVYLLQTGSRAITEETESLMKLFLREHHLKIRKAKAEYVPQKRPKIKIGFPWYSYQDSRRDHADD